MITKKQWDNLPLSTRRKALALLLKTDITPEEVANAWSLHEALIRDRVSASGGNSYRAIVGTKCIN